MGSFVYFGSSKLLLYKFKIDDPLDAVAIHGACGAWGVLSAGLFSDPKYSYVQGGGLFYGDTQAFGASIILILVNISWVGGLSLLLFGTMNKFKILKISEEMEQVGMDISKHGGITSVHA